MTVVSTMVFKIIVKIHLESLLKWHFTIIFM